MTERRGQGVWAVGTLMLAVVVGCGAPDARGDADAAGAVLEGRAGGAGASELIAGTPAGGLRDWVETIRVGTADLAETAQTDRSAAQRTALDLYIGRQEYLELYYGPAGREPHTEELGAAVLEAEARFHALLQMLAVDPVDVGVVRTGTRALHEQLDRVLGAAATAGVPAVLPGNVPVDRVPGR